MYLLLTGATLALGELYNCAEITEMLPGILNQLGAESLTHLKRLASNVSGGPGMGGMEGTAGALDEEEDDEVPDLVENFDEVSKDEKATGKNNYFPALTVPMMRTRKVKATPSGGLVERVGGNQVGNVSYESSVGTSGAQVWVRGRTNQAEYRVGRTYTIRKDTFGSYCADLLAGNAKARASYLAVASMQQVMCCL